MGDLFHESVPDEWIDQVFAIMALTPRNTYQLLTKRAARMRDYFAAEHTAPKIKAWQARVSAAIDDIVPQRTDASRLAKMAVLAPEPLPNVWLGVSTERQQEADERICLLLKTPAAVRFISAEPLLGRIDLTTLRPGRTYEPFRCAQARFDVHGTRCRTTLLPQLQTTNSRLGDRRRRASTATAVWRLHRHPDRGLTMTTLLSSHPQPAEDKQCPHSRIEFCPLYIAAHEAGGHGCDDGRLVAPPWPARKPPGRD
jgi:Protein of unknown function (DUF5131)